MARFYSIVIGGELKQLAILGGPLAVSNLAVVSIGMVDTMVAGHASGVDLAGLALGSGVWAICAVTLIGLLAAVSPVVAHMRGAGNELGCANQLRQAMWIALSGALVIALLLLLVPWWSQWIQTEEPVRQVMQGYLQALVSGVLPFAVGIAVRGYCEGMAQVSAVMRIYLFAALLNIPLDILLVFGAGPIPAMGGVGCGWATSIINWCITLALLWHLGKVPAYRVLKLKLFPSRPHWPTLRHLLALGLPICIGAASEVTFFASMTILLASYGAVIVASHQIALNIGSAFYLVALAMAQAVSIRVAWTLGQKSPDKARFVSYVGIGSGMVYALFTGIVLIALRHLLVMAYTSDAAVIVVASNLLLLCAAFQLVDVAQAMAWGALRGYKDTRVPMCLQIISYWLIGLPCAYWLGEAYWGVYGYWVGICIGLGAASILLGLRFWRVSGKSLQKIMV
ncbi:MAG: MATE family efflux transporter [Gammaproteobacteria bacterium]|nr:MATE family efflux transporter [Gammaproteobacteria bacterium]